MYSTLPEIIILIIALSFLIVYGIAQNTAPNLLRYIDTHKSKLTYTTLQDVLDRAENGDIILLAGDTSGERTCKWCTNTIFSHVGFLFREIHPETGVDTLYIFDCDLGQGTKEGVRVQPLIDKLHRYKGFRKGAFKKLLTKGDRPHLNDILELVGKYSPIEFDEYIFTWWTSNMPRLHTKIKNPKTMFCSELVAQVYQDLHILKKNHPPFWYHPGDFHTRRLDLEEGFSLGETQYFDFEQQETKLHVSSSQEMSQQECQTPLKTNRTSQHHGT